MRILPTKVHGLLDYLMGLMLFCAPFLFWDSSKGADLWIPILAGSMMILISVWTDYEWGAFRSISMRTHLLIDLAAGLLLALSPWIFGFADRVWLPFVLFGGMEVLASLITRTQPGRRGVLGANTL